MPNLWGHWMDFNQTWTHIHLLFVRSLRTRVQPTLDPGAETFISVQCARPGRGYQSIRVVKVVLKRRRGPPYLQSWVPLPSWAPYWDLSPILNMKNLPLLTVVSIDFLGITTALVVIMIIDGSGATVGLPRLLLSLLSAVDVLPSFNWAKIHLLHLQ